MLSGWKEFLSASGARINNDQVQNFGDPAGEGNAALTANTLVDLSYLCIVRISGADAGAFLHAQFTMDLARLPDGHVRPGAWCNPKGQVITTMIIARLAEVYYLVLPAEMKDEFITRLSKFVLRAQLTIQDCQDSLQCIGINTREAGQADGTGIAARLSDSVQAIHDKDMVMLHVPVNWNRVIMAGPLASIEAAWTYSEQLYHRTGSQYWRLFDVIEGMPWIGPGTTQSFLPQYLNLDQIRGLSYTKGCYPGQEIIARLHHRGNVKQRLYIICLDIDAAPVPGDRIYTQDKGQQVGTVINAATHPVEGIYTLAVLNTDYGEIDQLSIEGKQGRFKKISPPAYS